MTCRPRLEKRLREIDRGAGGVRGVPDPPLGIWDGQTLLQDLDDLESTSWTSAAREIYHHASRVGCLGLMWHSISKRNISYFACICPLTVSPSVEAKLQCCWLKRVKLTR